VREHWAGKAELGGPLLGMRLVFELRRRLGLWPFRLAIAPVVGYFFLTLPARRRASREYLRRLWAEGGDLAKPSAWTVLKHFWFFAETSLEKILAWDPTAPAPKVTPYGRQAVDEILAQGRGVLLIGSHLGNMEVARSLARGERQVKVNVLVHTRHAARFNALMAQINPQSQVSLFQVSGFGPETVMQLRSKVDQGEVVLIAGDRVPLKAEAGQGIVWAPFLGLPAPWPIGPYVLASVLECPVFLFFCLGQQGRYEIHYEAFADKLALPRPSRQQALAACAARYAERLGFYCKRAALQWANFYPFWDDPSLKKP
jgi:predicted LPLAT superfamily acyltransferase